jgi:acyl transferase domain-containing protein
MMKVGFVFTGHEIKRYSAGRRLLEEEPYLRETVEECDRLARQHVPWSLLEELATDEPPPQIYSGSAEIAQTFTFALQVALARLWHSWEIEPDVIVGYSMGKVAASHVAGFLSLPEAVHFLVTRSSLHREAMGQAIERGAVAWVKAPFNGVQQLIDEFKDQVWIATHNRPIVTMLSDDAMALDKLLKSLKFVVYH